LRQLIFLVSIDSKYFLQILEHATIRLYCISSRGNFVVATNKARSTL